MSAAIVVKQVDNVLTVPSAALTSEGDVTYVTLSKNGKETKTKVVIGTVYGASTQITSGPSEGDQVVIRQIRLPQGGTGNGNRVGRNGQVPGEFPGGGQLPQGQFPGGPPNGGQAPVGAASERLLGLADPAPDGREQDLRHRQPRGRGAA